MSRYIYFGCTVQCRSKLCKNIFKSVQYLNKEYSIYYPIVFAGCGSSNSVTLQNGLAHFNWTIHCRGVSLLHFCRLDASSYVLSHQDMITFSSTSSVFTSMTHTVVQPGKRLCLRTTCTMWVCTPHSSDVRHTSYVQQTGVALSSWSNVFTKIRTNRIWRTSYLTYSLINNYKYAMCMLGQIKYKEQVIWYILW